jgi:Fe-S-cluster containining protein
MSDHSVLDAWLSEKSNLCTKESLFRCDDACPRYGCRGELLVTVTLLELKAQARHLGRPVLEVFDQFCCTVPFVEHGLDSVRVRFVLRKPCLFLDDAGYCAIYPLRPAACALFPEFLSLNGDGWDYVTGSDLSHYPCIEHFAEVPEARKDVLATLMSMHRKEVYAGEIYLFGHAGFSFDLREEVSRVHEGRPGEPVPFSVQSDVLCATLSAGGWSDRMRKKIEALDTPEGLETFLSGMKIVEALNL